MQIHIGKRYKVLQLGALTKNYHQLSQTVQLTGMREGDEGKLS